MRSVTEEWMVLVRLHTVPGAMAAALLLAQLPVHAAAQELDHSGDSDAEFGSYDLEEVQVSALAVTNVLETLMDVPNSVSIVSGEELAKLDALNLDSILQRIGNVQWNYGNPKTGSISLRGIPTGGSETQDPSLGINFDNVAFAYAPFATGLDYIDVESVDVARGPQGFDGGRATTTGTISIRTRKPTFNNEASATILLGQDNALSTQAVIGGSVIDGLLAWRGAFLRNQREGAFRNNYGPLSERITFGDTNRTYGRVQFLLTPFPGFEALASFDYKPKASEYVNGTLIRTEEPDPYYANGISYDDWGQNSARAKLYRPYLLEQGYSYEEYLNNPMSTDHNRGIANGTKGASLNLTWDLRDITLTSTTGWRQNWFQAANDDNLPLAINSDGGLFVHYEQRSQELKLASRGGRALDYVVGLYYNQTESDAASRSHFLAEAGVWQASQAQYYGITARPEGYTYDTALVPTASGLGGSAAGLLLAQDSLKGLWAQNDTLTDNTTKAAYAKLDLHLGHYTSLPLTIGLGVRFSNEHRRTFTDRRVNSEGVGAALNPVAAGGFNSNASGALTGTNSDAQLLLADQVALRYFGAVPTGTPGEAYNSLTAAQRQQVAYAKAIRNGQRGTPTPLEEVSPFKDTLPTWMASVSWRATDNLSIYGAYQRGAKPGYAQNVTIPSLTQVSEEYTDAYEVGIRSLSFNRALIINASAFYQQLNDYQTSLYREFTDPVDCGTATPPCFLSVNGNLPQVTIRGIELDASYVIGGFSFRGSAVLNDIYYSKDVLLAVNTENNIPGLPIAERIFQAKGHRLAGTSKYSWNLAADYRRWIGDNYVFHVDANYNWKGRYNASAQRSIYGVYPSSGVLDLGVGIGTFNRSLDVTLLVKNALDDDKRISNPTANGYVPATPRWFGIQFSGRL
jgi:iron complex outermembrane receptor protein